MTYNDIFTCRNLLLTVPLHCEGRSLCGKTTASVLLLRVAYGRKADEFIGTMQGVRAELEREGKKDDEKALRQAQDKHAAEDAGDPGRLTRDELADIIDTVGTEGDLPFLIPGTDKAQRIPRADFLTLLAMHVC